MPGDTPLLVDFNEDDIRLAARVCHEVNRAYCSYLGDATHPPWRDAPAWMCESIENGVRYALAHPDARPEETHEAWVNDKVAAGWRYGPVKDPVLREHPNIVPYSQLPASQRVKDDLFLAVVRAFREK